MKTPHLSFHEAPWSELTTDVLYALLALRSAVFVVEQDCAYLDIDGLDQDALHVYALGPEGMRAYARILPPGSRFAEASIGRVCTALSERGRGLGRELMRYAIERAAARHGEVPLRISAQEYLEEFYEGFGFRRASEAYLEDGILHIEMYRAPEVDAKKIEPA